jgi:hypothetical protein
MTQEGGEFGDALLVGVQDFEPLAIEPQQTTIPDDQQRSCRTGSKF